jgi:hypothetical protein
VFEDAGERTEVLRRRSNPGVTLTAIDIGPKMLETAEAKANAYAGRIELRQMDVFLFRAAATGLLARTPPGFEARRAIADALPVRSAIGPLARGCSRCCSRLPPSQR